MILSCARPMRAQCRWPVPSCRTSCFDPPYEIIPDLAPALFGRLTDVLAGKPDAIVVLEMPGEIELAPPGWALLKRLGKGARQPTVGFFRRSAAPLVNVSA